MARKKITADGAFVRIARFVAKDGKKVEIIHQPYAIGIYVAVYVDGSFNGQGSMSYSKMPSAKKLREDLEKNGATGIEIIEETYGQYMKESDFEIINS